MYLSMQEIEQKYNGHWVFMVNCKKGEHHNIIGGEVIAFNKEKKPISDLWDKDYDSRTYFRYVGSIPDGMGVLL